MAEAGAELALTITIIPALSTALLLATGRQFRTLVNGVLGLAEAGE